MTLYQLIAKRRILYRHNQITVLPTLYVLYESQNVLQHYPNLTAQHEDNTKTHNDTFKSSNFNQITNFCNMTTLIKEEDSHSEILALPMLTVSHSTASMAEDDDLERDEVEEIEKGSAEINTKVYWSRLAVALGLTITGVAVTTWSYLALRAQETENFENAYAQFSRTVGQAAVEEMLRLREAARMFGHTVQATSELTNTTWPFYDYYDGIGVFAQEEVDAKQMESIQYLTRVQHSEREAYLDFQRQRYEQWVKEGHMQAYGHMDFLLDDPATYQDDILEFSTTDFTVNPSSDKEEYYPLAYRYPPPNSYFVVNFDISSINYDELFASMLHLKNQTLISNVNPYIEGDEAEKQYHAQFHDQLPDSKSDFPHSFLFHPIMKDAKSDEIIAVVTFPIAWDASLRRLLPSQVKGIIAVARNNCEQSVTYEIVGNEAFFLGWEDLHDTKYDDKEYVVNLDFSDHPEFEETKGHCVYSLSIYPSEQFEGAYKSSTPTLYVAVVGCTFALMILVFYVYDTLVQFRNRKIVREAARSNEIVTSMFPGALRDKIMNQKMAKGSSNKTWNKKSKQIAHALEHGDASMREMNISEDVAEPLAELHKQTTVFVSMGCVMVLSVDLLLSYPCLLSPPPS